MRSPHSEVHIELPRGRLKLGRLLWVVVVAGCFAATVASALFLLDSSTVRSRHSFAGTIRPVAAPVAITLPKGALLKEILVERGETVYRGQTVALLDHDAIADRLAYLQTRLLHDETLRSCLLTNPTLRPQAADISQPDNALNAAVAEAKFNCAASNDSATEREEIFQAEMDLLLADQNLLEQYVQTLVQTQEVSREAREKSIRQILSLQMAQNRLQERKLSLENDQKSARLAYNASRSEQLRQLSLSMRSNADLIRSLSDLLDKPRLQAPESGKVVRMRRFPTGTHAGADTEFIDIRPSNSQGYVARFSIPKDRRRFVKIGLGVEIELMGLDKRLPRLSGVIDNVITDGSGAIEASVAIDTNSTLALDDPNNGIALRGDKTAAVITIQFAQVNARAASIKAINDTFRSFGIVSPGAEYDKSPPVLQAGQTLMGSNRAGQTNVPDLY